MTPKEAVQKGFLIINLPIIALWLSLPIVSYTITKGKVLLLFFVIGSLFGLLLFSWIWWSLSSLKWEIKTLSNVRNVQELYERAFRAALIFPRLHFLQKHRLGSKLDKQRLLKLEQKRSVPDKTEFSFTSIDLKYELSSSILFLISELFNFAFPLLIGLFLMTNYSENDLFFKIGLGLIAFLLLSLFIVVPFIGKVQLINAFSLMIKALKKEKAIIIDQRSIRLTASYEPILWEHIKSMTVHPDHGLNLSSSGVIKFTFNEKSPFPHPKFHPMVEGIDWYLLQRIINHQFQLGAIQVYFQDKEINKG